MSIQAIDEYLFCIKLEANFDYERNSLTIMSVLFKVLTFSMDILFTFYYILKSSLSKQDWMSPNLDE